MSRSYNIQDRTRRKLAELNKRVSNKKSRYRREKGIELNPLIQTIKPSDFTSRKQVEKYQRDMQRFLDRKTQFVTNRNDAIFYQSTVKKYQKEIDRINRVKQREYNRIKNLETQLKGKKLGATVGQRIDQAPNAMFKTLQPFRASLDDFTGERHLKQALQTKYKNGYYSGDFITRQAKQYKQNFIDSLQTEFASKSANLQRKIKRMSIKDFMNIYYQTLGQIDIPYVYDDNASDDTRLNMLEETFNTI